QHAARAGGVHGAEAAGGVAGVVEADGGVDAREVRVIENVERLGSELHAGLLPKLEILEQADVPEIETGSDQNVAAARAELAGRHQGRVEKRFGLEPAGGRALA